MSMPATDPTNYPSMPLRDVANVQPGYPSRGRIRHAPDGTHYLLQGKDVSDSKGVGLKTAIRFHPEHRRELYQVSRGDVLFTARGQEHRAYYVSHEVSNVLAAASFYILRVDRNRLLPAYLAWWLNLPRNQSKINSASGGTYISYIRRNALENLLVAVPAMEVQIKIERVVSLQRERSALQAEIDEKQQLLIQALCLRAVQLSENEESEK